MRQPLSQLVQLALDFFSGTEVQQPKPTPEPVPSAAGFTHRAANRHAVLQGVTVSYRFERSRRKSIGFTIGPEGLVVRAFWPEQGVRLGRARQAGLHTTSTKDELIDTIYVRKLTVTHYEAFVFSVPLLPPKQAFLGILPPTLRRSNGKNNLRIKRDGKATGFCERSNFCQLGQENGSITVKLEIRQAIPFHH